MSQPIHIYTYITIIYYTTISDITHDAHPTYDHIRGSLCAFPYAPFKDSWVAQIRRAEQACAEAETIQTCGDTQGSPYLRVQNPTDMMGIAKILEPEFKCLVLILHNCEDGEDATDYSRAYSPRPKMYSRTGALQTQRLFRPRGPQFALGHYVPWICIPKRVDICIGIGYASKQEVCPTPWARVWSMA